MRVGFVTSLLWERYGPFWHKLVSGVRADALFPEWARVERSLTDERLLSIPGVAFRLAAAQALSLEADMIIVPDLNPGEERARGGGEDPWVASFPEALATLGGLPPLVGVPAGLEEPPQTLAVNTLHALTRDPALVRRVWERNRSLAKPPRRPEPRWRGLSDETVVGVIGQPWLLNDAVVDKLRAPGRHLVSQGALEPAPLREEGRRLDPRLVPTDREVLGAARYLSRKGSVAELVMVADRTGADAWLVNQAQRIGRKPLTVAYLHELLSPDDLAFLTPTP